MAELGNVRRLDDHQHGVQGAGDLQAEHVRAGQSARRVVCSLKRRKSVDFTLKQGIHFHGEYGEVTAEDVKFSYERAAGL